MKGFEGPVVLTAHLTSGHAVPGSILDVVEALDVERAKDLLLVARELFDRLPHERRLRLACPTRIVFTQGQYPTSLRLALLRHSGPVLLTPHTLGDAEDISLQFLEWARQNFPPSHGSTQGRVDHRGCFDAAARRQGPVELLSEVRLRPGHEALPVRIPVGIRGANRGGGSVLHQQSA